MRSFPRTAGQRLLAAAVAGLLALGVVSVPLAHAEDLKHRQQQVQGRIKHAQGDLDESSARFRRTSARLHAALTELRRARAHLERTREQLRHARKVDERMQRALVAAQRRLELAQADVEAGQADVEDQKQSVSNTIAEMYEEGDPQLAAFASLLQAESTSDLTWSAEGQSAIVDRQAQAYQSLQAAQVLLEVHEDQLDAAEREVAAKRAAAAEHLVVVEGLNQEARDAKAHVHEVVGERRDAARAARRARAHDRAQLAKLRKEEAHVRALIAAAAARASRSQRHFRGNTGGFLQRPVPGYVTSPYGYRVHPIYGYYGLHDGDDFHAPCGTPLRAAGTGTVIQTYYSSVWGKRLFLYLGQVNGSSVTVVYNHLSTWGVRRGSHVSRGQVIGYAGTTGWSTACHLHFSVLVDGRAVNPMNWL